MWIGYMQIYIRFLRYMDFGICKRFWNQPPMDNKRQLIYTHPSPHLQPPHIYTYIYINIYNYVYMHVYTYACPFLLPAKFFRNDVSLISSLSTFTYFLISKVSIVLSGKNNLKVTFY